MKKVSLRELVADKIIFAVLIAVYYWTWARNDWKGYYTTIQIVVATFTFYYFISRGIRLKKYKQETPDEMAEANLRRCDAICLKISVAVLIAVSFLCAAGRFALTTEVIGYWGCWFCLPLCAPSFSTSWTRRDFEYGSDDQNQRIPGDAGSQTVRPGRSGRRPAGDHCQPGKREI